MYNLKNENYHIRIQYDGLSGEYTAELYHTENTFSEHGPQDMLQTRTHGPSPEDALNKLMVKVYEQ
jgi:hypothetical protein